MPKFEIELDDKGEIVGTVASELDAIFKRTETASYGNGLKKGREDALAESGKTLEERIKAEREKWERENPVQRVKELDAEIKALRESEATALNRYTKGAREREEIHAKEMADKAEAIAKRDRRLDELRKESIRSEAIRAGARDESLDELASILKDRIGYDDEFRFVVKDESGKAMTTRTGDPMPLAEFVQSYLSTHQHHRKAAGGTGGGARGGANYQGHATTVTAAQAAQAVAEGDRSSTAINNLFESTRKKSA